MKKLMPLARQKFLILCAVAACVAVFCPAVASATSILGSAENFAVLGEAGVTNGHSSPNLPTQVYGNLGVTPSLSVTGFNPDGTVTGGTIHINDGVAQSALTDATTAYNTLASLSPGTTLSSTLVTQTLNAGVYNFTGGAALLTGVLTLDAQSNPNAQFVFQMATTLTTANGFSVNVINGNSTTSVYWQVGSSATLGDDTTFAGNILALASVALDPRAAILCGRAFALNASVTLIDNLISNNNTAQAFGSGRDDFGSYGFSGTAAPVPVPPTMLLLGSGLAGLVAFRKRFKKA